MCFYKAFVWLNFARQAIFGQIFVPAKFGGGGSFSAHHTKSVATPDLYTHTIACDKS